MGIERVPIRASIRFGNTTVSTPYILSFNVNKQRGSYSTFSASLKVNSSYVRKITGEVVIYAGEKGRTKKIFTGMITKKTQTPCWDDPSYQIINISGADALVKLEGMKITRRQFVSDSSWVKITSVSPGIKSGKLKLTNQPTIAPTGGGLPSEQMGGGTQTSSNIGIAGELSSGKTTAIRTPLVGSAEIVDTSSSATGTGDGGGTT